MLFEYQGLLQQREDCRYPQRLNPQGLGRKRRRTVERAVSAIAGVDDLEAVSELGD